MPTKASEATKGEAKVMKNASLKKPVAKPPRIRPKDISLTTIQDRVARLLTWGLIRVGF